MPLTVSYHLVSEPVTPASSYHLVSAPVTPASSYHLVSAPVTPASLSTRKKRVVSSQFLGSDSRLFLSVLLIRLKTEYIMARSSCCSRSSFMVKGTYRS